ncbi:mediator of RNA polymerase II transcription subunit 15-like isoform X2 [Littorina saxatilis]|uniref:mediator of RNA polymerase II transcription subunit 15-like isoform X2 n=1 Tax=Littorina saxatilis TaxID=31220 RepID=UPI0038B6AFF7
MCGCVKYMNPADRFELDEQALQANLPEGALVVDGVVYGSGEDQRLQAAAVAANLSGSTTPLLKEELRMRIMQRRIQDGKPEIKPEFNPPKDYKLTPAEKEKKERRKEQNRRAAKKCREKRKRADGGVLEKFERTQKHHQQLRTQIEALRAFSTRAQAWLTSHLALCNLVLPSQIQQSPNQQQKHTQQRQQQQQQQQLQQHREQNSHSQQQQQQHHHQQQQQHDYQLLVQQQQLQPMNITTDDMVYDEDLIPQALLAAGIIPEELQDACTPGPEHSMQGLGPVPSDEASTSLLMDSLDMDAALRGHTDVSALNPNPGLDSASTPLTSSTGSTFPSDTITTYSLPMNLPNFLHQPVSPANSPTGFAPQLQPAPSRPFSSASMVPQTIPQFTPDLPGYPFAGRKRRSVDESQQGKEDQHRPSTKKARLTDTPSSPATISHSGLPAMRGSSRLGGLNQHQQQIERSATGHQNLPPFTFTPSSSSSLSCGRQPFTQLNRPASTSPPLRFSSSSSTPPPHRLTPPPSHNSSLTPLPFNSSLTPLPHSSSLTLLPFNSYITPSLFSSSLTPPPLPSYSATTPPPPYAPTSVTPPPPSPLLPEPSPAQEERNLNDAEPFMGDLALPLRSSGNIAGGCEDGCLSSNCSLLDFLKDLSEQQSSQED